VVLPACQYDPTESDHVHFADGVTDDREGVLSSLTTRARGSKGIEIDQFVPRNEIDDRYIDSYNLSDLLDEQGRVEPAIECLRTTLRVVPDHVDAMFNIALLLQRTNQYAEAANDADEVPRPRSKRQKLRRVLRRGPVT